MAPLFFTSVDISSLRAICINTTLSAYCSDVRPLRLPGPAVGDVVVASRDPSSARHLLPLVAQYFLLPSKYVRNRRQGELLFKKGHVTFFLFTIFSKSIKVPLALQGHKPKQPPSFPRERVGAPPPFLTLHDRQPLGVS